jgi:2-polyprenyl-3-methyl-5-hydroxy-6-metoxy-1,4-benzoquinol methylase
MKNYLDINKSAYEAVACQYQVRHNKLKESDGYIKVIQYLDTLFTGKDNTAILDIGCGDGMALAKFNQCGFNECTGIDF